MKALKPIRTKKDAVAAKREIERLWDAAPGTPEHDRLEILATLLAAYEEAHCPIEPPDPVEAIRFRMEQMGISRKDLEACIGSRARVSEILGRKRSLTLPMIRRLHAALGIPAEILLAG